jgi:hypothetical protein
VPTRVPALVSPGVRKRTLILRSHHSNSGVQTNPLCHGQQETWSIETPRIHAPQSVGSTHEHLPEGLLGSDPQEVPDGSSRGRHGSMVRMRWSAGKAIEAERGGESQRTCLLELWGSSGGCLMALKRQCASPPGKRAAELMTTLPGTEQNRTGGVCISKPPETTANDNHSSPSCSFTSAGGFGSARMRQLHKAVHILRAAASSAGTYHCSSSCNSRFSNERAR